MIYNLCFDAFPKRCDRHQHVGIIGHFRDVDGYKITVQLHLPDHYIQLESA